MAFKIEEVNATSRTVKVAEKLWLAADGETLVPDGDPAAASLFAAAGDEVSREHALKYGLVKPDKSDKEAAAAAEEAQAEPEKLTVAEVLEQVGDDPAKAAEALDTENRSGAPRKSLVAKLEQLAGGEGA